MVQQWTCNTYLILYQKGTRCLYACPWRCDTQQLPDPLLEGSKVSVFKTLKVWFMSCPGLTVSADGTTLTWSSARREHGVSVCEGVIHVMPWCQQMAQHLPDPLPEGSKVSLCVKLIHVMPWFNSVSSTYLILCEMVARCQGVWSMQHLPDQVSGCVKVWCTTLTWSGVRVCEGVITQHLPDQGSVCVKV